MEQLRVNVKLEYSELIKLRFIATYKTPIIVFITFIGFGMLTVVISYLSGNNAITEGKFPTFHLVFAVFILFFIPFSVFNKTKKDLKENKLISQNIEYEFNKDKFNINGETFNMQNKWLDLYKIDELKEWFILYTSKNEALFIPKNRFKNNYDLISFSTFVNSLKLK